MIQAKRWQMVLAVLAGAALAGLLFYELWPREPSYQGISLSQWLEELYFGPAQAREKAKDAIRQMRTQALPELVQMIRAKDSRFKLKLMRLSGRQSLIRFHWTPAFERHNRAIAAFSALGSMAEPAMGPLTQMLNRGDTAYAAAQALIQIGPEAFSPLMQALTNQDKRVRYSAAAALGAAGPAARTGVPALIRRLKDPDPDVRISAALALARVAQDAAGVVPALVENLHDPHPAVRASTARALGRWGVQAKAAVPALLKLAQDPDRNVSNAAQEALSRINP